MGVAIAYDKPVANFIDALSATGHVTHTQHRKTSVTFHHNGGKLSLRGILEVWKLRPASAQFQVDGGGNVGQYVKVNEYAWATGTTAGNQQSINIEMANSVVGGNWEVAEVTWKEACRLAGWNFARVIGAYPTRANVKLHKDWKETICAGPYIESILDTMISEIQRWYAHFSGNQSNPTPAPTPPSSGITLDRIVTAVINGVYGNQPERQQRLEREGWNYAEVRAAVNARLSQPAAAQKSVRTMAQEVIAGKWGNGADRKQRLTAAGYNFTQIQNEVNRLLS